MTGTSILDIKFPMQKEPANAEWEFGHARSKNGHMTEFKMFCNKLSVEAKDEYVVFQLTLFVVL